MYWCHIVWKFYFYNCTLRRLSFWTRRLFWWPWLRSDRSFFKSMGYKTLPSKKGIVLILAFIKRAFPYVRPSCSGLLQLGGAYGVGYDLHYKYQYITPYFNLNIIGQQRWSITSLIAVLKSQFPFFSFF